MSGKQISPESLAFFFALGFVTWATIFFLIGG